MQNINQIEPTGGQVKRDVLFVPCWPNYMSDNKVRELNCPTTKPPTDFKASLKLINITQIDHCTSYNECCN